MAKNDFIDITPVDEEEQLNDAEFDEEDFEEEEEMTEKHPVKDFCSRHKKGLIAAGLTALGFVVGCATGATVSKKGKSESDDSSNEPLEIDCTEQESQEETIESTATEITE